MFCKPVQEHETTEPVGIKGVSFTNLDTDHNNKKKHVKLITSMSLDKGDSLKILTHGNSTEETPESALPK